MGMEEPRIAGAVARKACCMEGPQGDRSNIEQRNGAGGKCGSNASTVRTTAAYASTAQDEIMVAAGIVRTGCPPSHLLGYAGWDVGWWLPGIAR